MIKVTKVKPTPTTRDIANPAIAISTPIDSLAPDPDDIYHTNLHKDIILSAIEIK